MKLTCQFLRFLGLVPLLGCFAIAGADGGKKAGFDRDWQKFPAIIDVKAEAEIYALGDVHGDYERLASLLAVNHLIEGRPANPADVKWTGGKAALVCTGDLFDRWPQGVEVVQFFKALQADAAQTGGRVVVTMGNHEAEFLASSGDNHKTQGFERELEEAEMDPRAVKLGRDPKGLGQFLRSLPVVAIVNGWCFLHAGNTHGLTRERLQTALREDISREGFGAPILSDPDSLLEARLQPGPWWERGTKDAEEARTKLANLVRALGAEHLVVGHQPKKVVFADGYVRRAGQMCERFDGLLFLIDVGMSRGIDASDGALLKVSADGHRAIALDASGKSSALWSAGGTGAR
ncbi:MAG TPA: metallophosphoesterase [Verrucomicrobiae bacterium]|nr:metallophosphoesterase [Verrucomicrobiae bacterium]